MMVGTGNLRFVFPPIAGSPDVLPIFLLPSGTTIFNGGTVTIPNSVLFLISPALALLYPNGITLSIPGSCTDFTGYHFWTSAFVGTVFPPKPRVAYGVIPLGCAASPPAGSGFLSLNPSGFFIPLDDATSIVAHELVEALTDPFVPLGWIDLGVASPLTQGEAADKCSGIGVWYQNQMVAAYWSNLNGACVAGNNTLNKLTLSATFLNDTPPSLGVQLDGRTANLNALNSRSFDILVVNGTAHSYRFPASIPPNPSTMRIVPIDNQQPVNATEVIVNDTVRNVTYKTQYFVTVSAPTEANATPSAFYDVANLMISTAASYASGGNIFEFFNWIGTTAQTPSFNVLVNQPLAFQAQYVRDVTANITFTRSGLTFNRANQTFYGTITLKNNGNEFYSNALPLALTGLPAGVVLVNQGGTFKGNPWLPTPGANGFGPGASLVVPVQFKIPAGVDLNYGVILYSFH